MGGRRGIGRERRRGTKRGRGGVGRERRRSKKRDEKENKGGEEEE